MNWLFRLFYVSIVAMLIWRITLLIRDFRAGLARVERRYGGDFCVFARSDAPLGFWVLNLAKATILLSLLAVFSYLMVRA